MVDLSDTIKELDKLTPEDQELVKTVISALSFRRRLKDLNEAEIQTAIIKSQHRRGLITDKEYKQTIRQVEIEEEQEKRKPKPDMDR